MKNISQFAKQQNQKVNSELNTKNNFDFVAQAKKYEGKSQNEIQNELLKNVAMQKQNGTFNYQQLQETANSLSGYLSAEQQQNLKNMLARLK
ncbi:MAG: hypothetical protein RR140_03375 [Clostridia bacterium]